MRNQNMEIGKELNSKKILIILMVFMVFIAFVVKTIIQKKYITDLSIFNSTCMSLYDEFYVNKDSDEEKAKQSAIKMMELVGYEIEMETLKNSDINEFEKLIKKLTIQGYRIISEKSENLRRFIIISNCLLFFLVFLALSFVIFYFIKRRKRK